jgi:hypothetical protein
MDQSYNSVPENLFPSPAQLYKPGVRRHSLRPPKTLDQPTIWTVSFGSAGTAPARKIVD